MTKQTTTTPATPQMLEFVFFWSASERYSEFAAILAFLESMDENEWWRIAKHTLIHQEFSLRSEDSDGRTKVFNPHEHYQKTIRDLDEQGWMHKDNRRGFLEVFTEAWESFLFKEVDRFLESNEWDWWKGEWYEYTAEDHHALLIDLKTRDLEHQTILKILRFTGERRLPRPVKALRVTEDRKRQKMHTHGGKREGAGRPSIGTKTISVRFSGEDLEYLEALRRDDETLSMVAKRLIRSCLVEIELRKGIYATISEAREAIKKSGLSAQSGGVWTVDANTYQTLEDAAADALFRGIYEDPEDALIQEANRLGVDSPCPF